MPKGRMRVTEWLKVSKITSCTTVSDAVKFYAFIYLLCDAFVRSAVPRMKSPVITIRATTGTHRPVPVWTGKTGVYHHLLQACTVFADKITCERSVTLHPTKIGQIEWFVISKISRKFAGYEKVDLFSFCVHVYLGTYRL